MPSRRGKNWTREEALAALALYCQIPFGAIRHTNPKIIALAGALGRTPSSVSMKLANFASFDPAHIDRGVSGMSHASAQDRAIWDEYYGRWDILADHDALAEDEGATHSTRSVERVPRFPTGPTGPTGIERTQKHRRGQSFFRTCVLSAYESRCCVTGIANPALLRASHIVPWAESDDATRLNPHNGLCLNALHDAAFDRGLMTLDEDLRVVYTPRLWAEDESGRLRAMIGEYEGRQITTPGRYGPDETFLERHRERVGAGAR